jgi:endonuclease YncB( thermonuclease family)
LRKRIKALIFSILLVFLFVTLVEGQGQFVGSKNSDVYHYPSCHWAEQIKPENQIWFEDAQDAINHGYRPCEVCNPPLPDSQEPMPPTEEIISVFVNDVIDGDTFDTAEGYRIRLADVDAPEIDETGYLESVEYLELLVEDKTVCLNIDSISVTDPYERYVCLVFVEYNSTHYMNVNQALIIGNYAEIDDYTNNEFDPNTWHLYYPNEEIPEFSSWIILPLFLIATIVAIFCRNRLRRKVS